VVVEEEEEERGKLRWKEESCAVQKVVLRGRWVTIQERQMGTEW
jgi:hypothetical protein